MLKEVRVTFFDGTELHCYAYNIHFNDVFLEIHSKHSSMFYRKEDIKSLEIEEPFKPLEDKEN